MSDKIKPVRHLQFVDYSPAEYIRLNELIRQGAFPTAVRVETDPEFYFRTESRKFDDQFFTVEIDIIDLRSIGGGKSVEILPGQLVVWLGKFVMVFDQNGDKAIMTQYDTSITEIHPGVWL